MNAARHWSGDNWFLLLLPALLAVSWFVARSAGAGEPVEAIALFDWCVSVPILYFLCYRSRLTRRQMALRLFGLVCAGTWVAGHIVPVSAQEILPRLGWVRSLGVAVLMVVELRLLLLGIRIAFSGRGDVDALAGATGAPSFLARLMLLEARFWKWVWRLIRRR